jgi:pimeloyl-ACP methyl ester carboxylesterase
MLHVEDKRLSLSDGRTLAYADNGNTSSSSLVLFFHDAFNVGDASRLPHVLTERNIHFVAPTLPGWGRSSPVPASPSYATTLASDITALITHLHPHPLTSKLKLYVYAHAFGTVPAQMLYGLPHDVFPLGKQIAALILLSPLSPPHCHKTYASTMTWRAYFMAGPLATYIPFNIYMHLTKAVLASSVRSPALAEEYIKKRVIGVMDEEEREAFSKWRDDQGLEVGQLEREMGRNIARSVAHTWQGFLALPAVYHSGWAGFCPGEGMNDCPVFIVSPRGDYMFPKAMAEWLAEKYKSATLKTVSGGYISSFFHLDSIWNEVFLG